MTELEKVMIINKVCEIQDIINEYANKYGLEFELEQSDWNYADGMSVSRHYILNAIIPARIINKGGRIKC